MFKSLTIFSVLLLVLFSGCTTQVEHSPDNNLTGLLNERIEYLESLRDRLNEEVDVLEAENTDLQAQLEELNESYNYLEYLYYSDNLLYTHSYVDSDYGNGYRFFVPDNLDWYPLTCTGSMIPTINCDDIVLGYTPTSQEEIREGDIISYATYDGSEIMHRVTQIAMPVGKEWEYLCRGDGNSHNDQVYVPFSKVTGKVVAVIYNGSNRLAGE